MDQILTEVVGVIKKLIWDVGDLRHDIRSIEKPSHLVEKLSSLDDFQRIIALYGLNRKHPYYELCVIGSKGSKKKFMKHLQEDRNLNTELDNVIQRYTIRKG